MILRRILREIINLEYYLSKVNIEIAGKPLSNWIILIILYSFIIWISIIMYNGYQFYKEYTLLTSKIKNEKNIIRVRKRILSEYYQKLMDVTIAYNEISKYFNKQQVKYLIRKLDAEIREIEKYSSNTILRNSINFYRIETFNIKQRDFIRLDSMGYTLNNISFNSIIINKFQESLNKKLNSNKPIKLLKMKVKVTLLNNKIVMYLAPTKQSIFIIKPVLWKGLIKNPYRIYVFPTETFFYKEGIVNNNFISPIYVGWQIKLSEGGL